MCKLAAVPIEIKSSSQDPMPLSTDYSTAIHPLSQLLIIFKGLQLTHMAQNCAHVYN